MSDDTDDQQAQDGADLPIDQDMAERVVKLYSHVDEVLDELRVPDEERKEVEQNLMEAIAADLLVRLGEKLSDDDKEDLAKIGDSLPVGAEPDLNAVAGFFRDKFDQQQLVQALAEATESVLSEFTDAMQR